MTLNPHEGDESLQELQIAGTMDRKPNLQTITWLLNLRRFGQLDLEPPYQRKSVWSRSERQRFLDTIIRNYPSPAIFLHVTYSSDGSPEYHVVDGKQRLTTILDFVDGLIRLPNDFGDVRLDGKRWKDLESYPAIRKSFWNYKLTVEEIDDVAEPVVREVFERLNRNSRKLEPQEMRHARFDGWLISFLENEVESTDWKDLRLWTAARAKRMYDVQVLSELAAVIIRARPAGFDQGDLDALYAEFDEVEAEENGDFDAQDFRAQFEEANSFLRRMEEHNGAVTRHARSMVHLYPLWCLIALNRESLPQPTDLADQYIAFMDAVAVMRAADIADPARDRVNEDRNARRYLINSSGASTEEPQRLERYEALCAALIEG